MHNFGLSWRSNVIIEPPDNRSRYNYLSKIEFLIAIKHIREGLFHVGGSISVISGTSKFMPNFGETGDLFENSKFFG